MATYSAAVEYAITGSLIEGRGFSDYLEHLATGLWILKLDNPVGLSEFVVTANPWQVLGPNKYTITTWKVMDPPPPRPPGTYIVLFVTQEGVMVDCNFDVIVNTLK